MKVAILGYGVEGKSVERYVKKHYPKAEVKIFENLTEQIDANGFDLVFRTPSIAPSRIKADGEVTSSTQLFFDKCPAQIIGVTGTKGKGTTCSLITAVLRAAGYTVHLVGNIGVPALDELDKIRADDIVVYELSSFQLWDLNKSPQTAVIVHIEPDHLNVHSGFDEYVDAKSNIVKYQTANDTVVYDAGSNESVKIAQKSLAKKLPYPSKRYASFDGNNLLFLEQIICSRSDLKVPGAYNVFNALAAINAAWRYTQNPKYYKQGFSSFTGLPHRTNLVKEAAGVKYYDNSIATVPGSTIADIQSFEAPKVMIIGGVDKGVDMSELVKVIKNSNVRQTVLVGASANGLEQQFVAAGIKNYVNLGMNTGMSTVVECAASSAQPGDIVLLSPAHASFDMFKNYSERGDQFVAAVNKL